MLSGNGAADPAENAYGVRKRLEYLSEVVSRCRPRNVLDVGCGTGGLLTFPLAARFPGVWFTGADVHRPSIEFAREHYQPPNLIFVSMEQIPDDARFDLVIVSEVIEHVDQPRKFLLWLRERLSVGGRIVLTLPNGYGPFEMMSLVEAALGVTGIYRLLRAARRRVSRPPDDSPEEERDTLAVDHHVNFFSFAQIQRLIESAGLRVVQYRPRTFLCGFGLDRLVGRGRVAVWNARVADLLPPWMNSAWMFVLETSGAQTAYRDAAGMYARLHRWMNAQLLRRLLPK